MLISYITDADLKKYSPSIAEDIWDSQVDYGIQIEEAFSILMDDIHNEGENSRLLMPPIALASESIVASSTGSWVLVNEDETEDKNMRRVVVDVSAISGSWSYSVEGATGVSGSTIAANSITSLTITSAGTHTSVFTPQYRYYRIVVEGGVSGVSASHQVTLTETSWDRPHIYKTLSLIFEARRTGINDMWDLLYKSFEQKYQTAFNTMKYLRDNDESGTAEPGEQVDSIPRLIL